jgi:nucleoside-diphosphate-sugar epimerase
MGHLYGYGPVDGPMTEDTPQRPSSVKGGIRVRMWADMLAAHRAGRIRATEARASDFVGPGARSMVSDVLLPPVKAGRTALVPANVDCLHSLTYTVDAGRTLAALGTSQTAWGRPWHVPTPDAVTLRQVATQLAELAGAPAPRLRRVPNPVLRAYGLFSPFVREFVEMRYQFERPFVLDSSRTEQTFGLKPTPLADVLRLMV